MFIVCQKSKVKHLLQGCSKIVLSAMLCLTANAEDLTNQQGGFINTYKAATMHDPLLRKSYQTFRAEQEGAKISTANLLPDVRLSANYQYEDSDNIYTDEDSRYYDETLERSAGELIDHSWRVSIRQPLFDYTAFEEYRSGKAHAKMSKHVYQRQEQELIYRVTQNYLNVLLAAQEVYLYEQKLTTLEQKLVQLERARELKVSDQLTVLRAKAQRDIARSDLLQAKSKLSDTQTLLSNITGTQVTPPEHWVRNSYNISPNLLNDNQEAWLKSVANNANVKAAQEKIKRDKYLVTARKAEHLPKITLSLSHYDRVSEDDFRTRKESIAAIELSMPLYSGGRTQASIRKARATLRAAEAEYDYIKAEKEQQIKLSYDRLLSFKERLDALAESRESSKGYLEAAERQQTLNLSDQTTVLEAQTQLLDTQISFAKTLNDYLISDLLLMLESGKLSQSRLADYDQLFNDATLPSTAQRIHDQEG